MKDLEERQNRDQMKVVSKTDEILKKMQEKSNGKVIHSQFYLQLSDLKEKIDVYKRIFYSRSPKFNKRTQAQAESIEKKKRKQL